MSTHVQQEKRELLLLQLGLVLHEAPLFWTVFVEKRTMFYTAMVEAVS